MRVHACVHACACVRARARACVRTCVSWPAIVTKSGPSVCHVFLTILAVLVCRHFPLVLVEAVAGTQQTQMNTSKAPIQMYTVYIYICIVSINRHIPPQAKRYHTIGDPKEVGVYIYIYLYMCVCVFSYTSSTHTCACMHCSGRLKKTDTSIFIYMAAFIFAAKRKD